MTRGTHQFVQRVAAIMIVATLATPIYAGAQGAPSTGPGPTIQHIPVACFVAGEVAQLDAALTPPEDVASVNIYFHSALGSEDFYTPMSLSFGDQFLGTIPPPRPDARTITYRIEAAGSQGISRTAEHVGVVVKRPEDCDGVVAAVIPGAAPPVVFSSATGALASATGFGAPGAAAGSGLSGTTWAIIGGAAALGVGTVIVVTRDGDDDNNASPSR